MNNGKKGSPWGKYLAISLIGHAVIIIIFSLMDFHWFAASEMRQEFIEIGFTSTGIGTGFAGGSTSGTKGDDNADGIGAGPAINPVSLKEVTEIKNNRNRIIAGAVSSSQEVGTETVDIHENSIGNAVVTSKAGLAAGNDSGHSGDGSGGLGNSGSGKDASGTSGSGGGRGGGLGAGFTDNGDGTYTASSSAGINYKLLRDAEAVYPSEARSIGYNKSVEVVALIMVGLDGTVESVNILSDPPKLGFREAAELALWRMRFAPIYHKGVNIRVPFEKHLIFQP